jgi:C1A family cysteine protease
MTNRRFFTGWKRQDPDHRDWHYVVPRRMTAQLPAAVELSAHMPPVLDQESLGCCGPTSADECIEYDERTQGMPIDSASRLFIYWVTRSMMSGQPVNQDSGVDNRTMLKAIAQYGFCRESMWPYATGSFATKPTAECFTAALSNRIKSYAAVQQTLDQMKGCIASGFPFLFGFDVFASFMTDSVAKTGIIPMPMTIAGDKQVGGHDVTIFGYDDSTQMFKFRNHWLNADGTPWGDQGNGCMPYNYALSTYASDFWVINAVPGAPVPPQPGTVIGTTGFSGSLTFANGILQNAQPNAIELTIE